MTARRPFTFLEVLVAVIVCGTLLTVILAAVTENLQNAGLAEDYTAAALLARARLAELSVANHLEAGANGGDFGSMYPRFKWQQTLRAASTAHGFAVEVDVSFERHGVVRTTRLHSWLLDPSALVRPKDTD